MARVNARVAFPRRRGWRRNVRAISAIRPVLGLEALHHDFGAGRQVILGESAAQECVRRASFHSPCDNLPVLALHVEVDPGVRIRPFNLSDGTVERDRLLGIELGGECMVGGEWAGSEHQAQGCDRG